MAPLEIVDTILLVYFILEIVSILLLNPQVAFPSFPFPKPLPQILSWYIGFFGDHLADEKPNFMRGLLANSVVVLVPLSIANTYAVTVSANQSWYSTTCLIQGVCAFTTVVVYISGLTERRTPTRLYVLFIPFVGFALLAIFRGVAPLFMETTSTLQLLLL